MLGGRDERMFMRIHTYIHACIIPSCGILSHTYIHAYIHAYIHTYTEGEESEDGKARRLLDHVTYIHTCMHAHTGGRESEDGKARRVFDHVTYIHKNLHTYCTRMTSYHIHTYIHVCMHT